ncbi:MAG: hypothetical protein V3V05_07740 [Pontiella sp.]
MTFGGTTTAESTSTIFTDGFEECFANWITGGAFCSGTFYEGAQSAKMDNTEYVYTSLSTVGYTSITIKYVVRTSNLEAGDRFVAEWYDGSSWNNIETISSGFATWTLKKFILPAGADNNADFRLQFRVDTVAGNPAYVDAVEVIGSSGGTPDLDPPTPYPMTFATAPYSTGSSSIEMVATTASDASGVEYYFTAIDGGNDSGWQNSTTYEDTGLLPDTQYSYIVTAGDKSANLNNTAGSSAASATTDVQGVAIDSANADLSVAGTVSGN